MMMKTYAYAVIRKSDNIVIQVNATTKSNWILDNDFLYNIPISYDNRLQYLDKYYYNNQWYSRTWNEYEENEYGETVPVEESGYVDTPWSPIKEGEVNV